MSSAITDRPPPAVVAHGSPPRRASRLPAGLRVPILIVLNLGIQVALSTFAADVLPKDVALASSKATSDYDAAARFVYQILMVWLGWHLKYDFIDVGALTLIADAPYAYLVRTYYDVSLTSIITRIHIDLAAIMIPTYLLRPRSALHNPHAPLRNRFLLNSVQVQAATGLLAVGVYVVVLWSALKTHLLNPFLVTHFQLVTLEHAHNETPIQLIWKTAIAGLAAQTFLLYPSITSQPSSGAVTPVRLFDSATATLPETLQHNVWFFSKRTKTLVQQTVILCAFLFANTVRRASGLEGADLVGAAGYAGLWVLATVICAGWWVWVGDTEA
ncbi:hypothetical protein BDV95DRAFT_612843 [Massariosphaeria phaeospora]|uniref:Uncharacterized protein n=1 Tax=Massariosphaeria phaeospora TaxID=100035 RepID=A0A7C8M231_9PLEO|nr:hypothetical protein BDV95DRAFT_612843 [Massariosphaeria phaeospora]